LISNDVKIISLINKVVPSKWYSKVHIVVVQDYYFDVIALIDSGADLNCIPEGLIPNKYFEKLIEKLNSANGSRLQINYELNNVHVCQNNVCLYTPSVLIKNITDKVIIGIPFIFMLYPFSADDEGISIVRMGVPVKFHFASRFDIDVNQLNLISAKTKHLNFLKQEIKYKLRKLNTKRFLNNFLTNCCNQRLLFSIIRLLILFVLNFPMLFGIERTTSFLYLMSKIFLKTRFLLRPN
jgi:hypothetical protein